MKKYLSIIKMVILEKMQFLTSKIVTLIMYAIFIYLFLQLWQYMYGEDQLIAGYTLQQMVWYVAVTEMIWFSIRPKNMMNDMTMEIKSGKVAYILNKPFSYIGYMLSKHLGEAIVAFTLHLVVGLIVGFLIIGGLSTFSVVAIPFIIITTVFATFITAFIYMIIAMLSFWFEDNSPFFWIYEKLILAIGVMFPIEIFPMFLQPFIKLSPIYVTMYAPAKMFVDFSFSVFIELLVFQIAYLLLMIFIVIITYKKGAKILSVNGG